MSATETKIPETAEDLPEGCDAYLTDAAIVPCLGDSGLYQLVGILTLTKRKHQHLIGVQIQTSAIMDRLAGGNLHHQTYPIHVLVP